MKTYAKFLFFLSFLIFIPMVFAATPLEFTEVNMNSPTNIFVTPEKGSTEFTLRIEQKPSAGITANIDYDRDASNLVQQKDRKLIPANIPGGSAYILETVGIIGDLSNVETLTKKIITIKYIDNKEPTGKNIIYTKYIYINVKNFTTE